MKKALLILCAFFTIQVVNAQRHTDNLDRGLVAVKTASGVFCSWRVQADEYYDVKYNLYRNGSKLNSEPLDVSNYTDAGGSEASTYTVKAVINGLEQAASKSVSVWSTKDGNNNPYLSVPMKDVVDRKGNIVYCCCGNHTPDASVAQNYVLNDCSVADLDGDGEMEIIVKRQNYSDEVATDPYAFNNEIFSTTNDRAYTTIEAYKLNGTRLWWIDCGPNMASMNSVEINVIAYDWDEDGKAEVVIRGADNMIIHKADGSVHNVGNMSVNTRKDLVSHTSAQYAWTHTGAEYLLYLNGATAAPYQVIDYPLPRYEADEIGKTEQQVWSPANSRGGYGHRSSKYFFGAPVLDGRHASIFLARGIYTQTKMCALDVNPSSHTLTTRWTWRCKDTASPWFGQGNHNFSIADVDGDGCDEIIYGSMVIDNNGKGLSTTGLGHGDALHVGDLDPFRKGLEVFACNEDEPSNNFRNATTSEIYLREPVHYKGDEIIDDGRCMAGNFTNDYPGCIGASTQSGIAALSMKQANPYAPTYIEGWANNWTTNTPNPALNWRIYWDGDLLEESMNGPGSSEGELFVAKNGNRLMMTNGAKCNNDTKKNPSFTGDIVGDWREEIIMRSSDNKELRIYTTTIPTTDRIPCLWYDHEYRQAMVWQMCGYNQPPHVSYFMGELEGLTKVPVPLTMAGRTEITTDNGAIPSSADGKAIIAYNKNIGIPSRGAAPSQLIIDVPSTVSGNDNNSNITYSYASNELGNASDNGDLTGNMHLVKQGDGLLKIAAREYSYTGNTDVFAGSVYFCGTLNSPVWMNRHTTLYTAGTYNNSVTMEYGSTLYISEINSNADGSAPTIEYSTATINTLNLHEGSKIVFDVDKSGGKSDVLNVGTLSIRKRNWQYGPEYLAPVFLFNSTSVLPIGNYKIGTISTVEGSLSDVIIEGNFASGTKQNIIKQGSSLYLKVYDENDEETEPTNVIAGVTTILLDQDFEDAATISSGWSSSVTGRFFATQAALNNGSHYAKFDAGNTNGATFTYSTLANAGSEYTSLESYILEFDFAIIPVNGASSSAAQTPTFTIYDRNGNNLCYWEVTTAAKTAAANSTGQFYLGTEQKGTFSANIVPFFYHVKITGSSDGTIMKVTDQYEESVQYSLSSELVYVGRWTYSTGKQYGGLCLDNIKLYTETPSSLTLEPSIEDSYETGIYGIVVLNRSINAGYSSLCVPFNTTVSELTNNDSEAYVAYLSDVVKEDNNLYSLKFTKTQEIEANMPYILYISRDLTAPSFTNKPVLAENAKTLVVDDWSMTGNYDVNKDVSNLYIVGSCSAIEKGKSTINGFTTYLTSSNSQVESLLLNSDGDALSATVAFTPTVKNLVMVIKQAIEGVKTKADVDKIVKEILGR